LDWCRYLLEGKNVNLRVMEKGDLGFHLETTNNVSFYGEHGPVTAQMSLSEAEKRFENPSPLVTICERVRFMIEKKEGTKIGFVAHYLVQPTRLMEIGYGIIPIERGKGYGTEAVQIMVDYLFLSKDIFRVQAVTNVGNKASQRVLEKAGFKNEGTLRDVGYVRGERTDAYVYSILREEWKEPKTLTKTA
jgi:RimJ/RimL family protein N-acetyltransferase